MTNQIDQKINDLFEVVRKQKAEVEAAEKESKQSWLTNCSIHLEGNNAPVNLQTANESTIKRVVVELLKHQDYTRKAEELLELSHSSQYDGFSYSAWVTDCKKRLAVIGIRVKKEKLAQLEERLNSIVSPEQRRQMELDAITKSLAG